MEPKKKWYRKYLYGRHAEKKSQGSKQLLIQTEFTLLNACFDWIFYIILGWVVISWASFNHDFSGNWKIWVSVVFISWLSVWLLFFLSTEWIFFLNKQWFWHYVCCFYRKVCLWPGWIISHNQSHAIKMCGAVCLATWSVWVQSSFSAQWTAGFKF